MATTVAQLVDEAKALADRRNDASIPDADWVLYVSRGVEDLYRLLVSLDPGSYFSTADFSLTGGLSTAATFNLAPSALTARLATAAALPANTASGGPGPGRVLQGNANGALTVDGTATALNDLILVQNEANQNNNGVWQQIVVGTGSIPFILLRVFNFDQALPTEIQVGATVTVTAGATNAGKTFYVSSFGGTVDSSPIVFTQGTGINFRALHGLDLNPDTTNRRTVPRRNFRERNTGRLGNWTPTLYSVDRAYDLRAQNIVITPYEFAGGSYRVYYRAAPYKFTSISDTTTLDFQLDPYSEWIVIKAARKALKIEETDAAPWSEELAELRQSITDEHTRDDTEPFIIADVEGDSSGGSWGFP